jgi:hypothetical protein
MSNPIANADLAGLANDMWALLTEKDYGLGVELHSSNLFHALPEFLAKAAAHARLTDLEAEPTKHNHDPQPFGRKLPLGECPRCDELHTGAAPRARFGGRLTVEQQDERRAQEIREHDCKASNCSIVCTFGDW